MLATALGARTAPLLVLSVDGLDWRYLRDADRLGLKIPNLRRLMAEGEVAQGVIGVYPTVTWPSHTSSSPAYARTSTASSATGGRAAIITGQSIC